MAKNITIMLNEDQANAIWRILEYGKADPQEVWVESREEFVLRYTKDDKQYNAFIERIRTKIAAALYG